MVAGIALRDAVGGAGVVDEPRGLVVVVVAAAAPDVVGEEEEEELVMAGS